MQGSSPVMFFFSASEDNNFSTLLGLALAYSGITISFSMFFSHCCPEKWVEKNKLRNRINYEK